MCVGGQATPLFYSNLKRRKDKYLQASHPNTDSSVCKICRNVPRDTFMRYESFWHSFCASRVPARLREQCLFFHKYGKYERVWKGMSDIITRTERAKIQNLKHRAHIHFCLFLYAVSVNTWSCFAYLTNRGEAVGLQASHTNKTHLFYLLTATLSAHHNNKGALLAEKNLLIYSSC